MVKVHWVKVVQHFNDDKKGDAVFVSPKTWAELYSFYSVLHFKLIANVPVKGCPACSISLSLIPCPLVTPWNAARTWD